MKRNDYRRDLKRLTNEQLRKRIDKLTDQVVSEATFDFEFSGSTSKLRQLTYAENLLKKREAQA